MGSGSAAKEILQFFTLIVILGLIIIQTLQFCDGGLQAEDGSGSYGLLNRCSYGEVTIENEPWPKTFQFRSGVCHDILGPEMLPDYNLVYASRVCVGIGIPCSFLLLLITQLGGVNRVMNILGGIVLTADNLCQMLVTVFVFVVEGSTDGYYIAWPWIMAPVALGLILLISLLFFIRKCIKDDDRGSRGGRSDHGRDVDTSKRKVLRWLIGVLIVLALILICLVHGVKGANGIYRQRQDIVYYGVWYFCMKGNSTVKIHHANSFSSYKATNKLCLVLNEYTNLMVNWQNIAASKWLAIMADILVFQMLFFVLYTAHEKRLNLRKTLSIVRIILGLLGWIFLLVSNCLYTSTVPSKSSKDKIFESEPFQMNWSFICPWIGFGLLTPVIAIYLYQAFFNKNFLGEIPEAEEEDTKKKNERRRLNDGNRQIISHATLPDPIHEQRGPQAEPYPGAPPPYESRADEREVYPRPAPQY